MLRSRIGALRRFGNVVPLEGSLRAPLGNQAKLARYFLASRYEDQFVCTDDIDTIHVTDRHLLEKFNGVSRSYFVAMGAEDYVGTQHEGNFPAGNFAGPGFLFAKLFSVGKKNFREFIDSFVGRYHYSLKEDPGTDSPNFFSDEYLIRALLTTSKLEPMIQHIRRDINPREEWLDRGWWPTNDVLRASIGNYVLINLPRPYVENQSKIDFALRQFGLEVHDQIPLRFGMAGWRRREKLRQILEKLGVNHGS